MNFTVYKIKEYVTKPGAPIILKVVDIFAAEKKIDPSDTAVFLDIGAREARLNHEPLIKSKWRMPMVCSRRS